MLAHPFIASVKAVNKRGVEYHSLTHSIHNYDAKWVLLSSVVGHHTLCFKNTSLKQIITN